MLPEEHLVLEAHRGFNGARANFASSEKEDIDSREAAGKRR